MPILLASVIFISSLVKIVSKMLLVVLRDVKVWTYYMVSWVQETKLNRFYYFKSNALILVILGSCSFNAYIVFNNRWRKEKRICELCGVERLHS